MTKTSHCTYCNAYIFDFFSKEICNNCEDKKNNTVIIEDWAGNELFRGPNTSKEILHIFNLNTANNEPPELYVHWLDESRQDNVYEHIDF